MASLSLRGAVSNKIESERRKFVTFNGEMARLTRAERTLLAMGIMPTGRRKDETEHAKHARQEAACTSVKAILSTTHWDIDDLDDAGLDGVLSLESCTPVHERQEHGSTTAVRINYMGNNALEPARKRRPDKPGFFDLPAELRLEIYELYCILAARTPQSLQDNTPADMVCIPTQPIIPGRLSTLQGYKILKPSCYWPFILKPQLICRQFSEEYLATASSVIVFEITNKWLQGPVKYHGPLSKIPEIKYIWTQTRDFLANLPTLARQQVRHIKFVCEITIFHAEDNDRYKPWAGRMGGDQLEALFECLSDVRGDFTVEIELVGMTMWADGQRVKKNYILRQRRPVRGQDSDWVCEEGPLLIRRCENCGRSEFISPSSKCSRHKTRFEPLVAAPGE